MKKNILILLVLALVGRSYGQEVPSAFTTKSVDVFKNGMALVTMESRVKWNDGTFLIRPVPRAAFGTLWMASLDPSVRIEDIRSVNGYQPLQRLSSSILEVLKANVGKKITFGGHGDSKPVLSGILASVSGSSDRVLATVTNGSQTVVVPVTAYENYFEFADGYNAQTSDSVAQTLLRVRPSVAKGQADIRMVYLQSQIGWTPGYRVDLVDDKKAQIVLSATLVNDAQDIEDATLNFVVGFPHFLYGNVESPLTSSSTFSQFIQALSGQENPYPYRSVSALANQSAYYELNTTAEVDFGNVASIEGQAEEDLFLYPMPHVTLAKGERTQVNLFSAQVPYAHIYEVELANALDGDNQSNKNEQPVVWHSVRLENTSPYPWTTGSGLTIQNNRALGQDILKYTPMKATGRLKITQAPDIKVTEEEKEVQRKEDVHKKDGYYYDLVSVGGKITVANHKDKDVTLHVTRPVTGTVTSSNPTANVWQQVKIGNPVNTMNTVSWEVDVKAGKTSTIEYQYDVYLRH